MNWFFRKQDQDGYWWGELEADTTLESDYILYLSNSWAAGHPPLKVEKLAKYIPATGNLPTAAGVFFTAGPFEVKRDRKGLRQAFGSRGGCR